MSLLACKIETLKQENPNSAVTGGEGGNPIDVTASMLQRGHQKKKKQKEAQ